MTDSSKTGNQRHVRIGPKRLEGILTVPDHAKGLVIFAHGSGSSRLSPRNTYVAKALNARHLATHLFEEPGALDQVVDAAGSWFKERLGKEQS